MNLFVLSGRHGTAIPDNLIDDFDPYSVGIAVWCFRSFIDREVIDTEDLILEAEATGRGDIRATLTALMDAGIFQVTDELPTATHAEQIQTRVKPTPPPVHTPLLDDVARSKSGAHLVYYHWGADDRLLYVGVTNNMPSRLKAHRRSIWWDDVARITATDCGSRSEALRLELNTIIDERPPFNTSREAYRSDPLLKAELGL